MIAPHVYVDPDGNHLCVTPGAGGAEMKVRDRDGDAHVVVTPRELPGLIAALHKAAGLPVPFLLFPDQVGDGWVHVTGTRGAA